MTTKPRIKKQSVREKIKLPKPVVLDLPEKPIGFGRKMFIHFNFGGGKGGAVFSVFDMRGGKPKQMPFGYQYNTQKGGLTGFTLPGVTNRVFTWAEIRDHYA